MATPTHTMPDIHVGYDKHIYISIYISNVDLLLLLLLLLFSMSTYFSRCIANILYRITLMSINLKVSKWVSLG